MIKTIYPRTTGSRLASVIALAACFCGPSVSAENDCLSPVALDLFRHEIAYQRTEETNPVKGLTSINANVWERGPNTAIYIQTLLSGLAPTERLGYMFDEGSMTGYLICPVAQDWKACVQASAPPAGSNQQLKTCTTTINLSDIPAWEPSPDSPAKRKLASELLAEIADKWPAAQEITVRDFNLKDPQITMVLKAPDDDYVQGCSLYVNSQPHCDHWHSFGMVPNSKIKQWVLEKPYRLK